MTKTTPMGDEAGERERLRNLLRSESLMFGDFTLASGRKSRYYFDSKKTTLLAEGAWLTARLVLRRIREAGIQADAIGGLTLGADPIVCPVAALSHVEGPPLRAFLVRKEVKDHGTGKPIEGPVLQPGQRVTLVEDTITTGGAVLQAYDRVVETGADVVEAIVIVDREEGGREALAERGLPLHALFRRSEFPTPARA